MVDKGKKTSARIGRAVAGCVYASFTLAGIEVLMHSGGGKSQADSQSSWSAQAMSHTGGRWAVAAAGLHSESEGEEPNRYVVVMPV